MANIIEYSGYIGTIEYSQEDKYFFTEATWRI